MNTQMTGYPSIDKAWLEYYSEEAINALLPEGTIYDYLYESNRSHPKDVALNYFGRKITFQQLFGNIEKQEPISDITFTQKHNMRREHITLCAYCAYRQVLTHRMA